MPAQRHLKHGPLSFPVGPTVDRDFLQRLQGLNQMLKAWGFRAPADFKRDLITAFASLPADDPDAVAKFVAVQDEWIMQRDEILNEFDQVLGGEIFAQLSAEVVAHFWKEMTSVAFQVMYAMSSTEARLDMLPVS
ncbi:hypothetical protein V8D89_012139 [Ganoderma adspersum]